MPRLTIHTCAVCNELVDDYPSHRWAELRVVIVSNGDDGVRDHPLRIDVCSQRCALTAFSALLERAWARRSDALVPGARFAHPLQRLIEDAAHGHDADMDRYAPSPRPALPRRAP